MIAFDTASGVAIGASNPQTWSHTCTGSGLILFVSVYHNGTISAPTYNAVTMTLVATVTPSGGLNNSLYYLINPATGSHSISIAAGTASQIGGNSSSYTGVAQLSTPIDNSTTNTGNAASLTTSLTTNDDNCWTVLSGICNITPLGAGTGSTSRNIQNNTVGIFDSNGVIHPAGSTSMQITCGSGTVGAIMVSITSLNHYVMAAAKGTFTLTGSSAIFLKAHNYVTVVSTGVFTLTGKTASFVSSLWTRLTSHVSAMANGTKSSSPTWPNSSKDGSSWTGGNKSS